MPPPRVVLPASRPSRVPLPICVSLQLASRRGARCGPTGCPGNATRLPRHWHPLPCSPQTLRSPSSSNCCSLASRTRLGPLARRWALSRSTAHPRRPLMRLMTAAAMASRRMTPVGRRWQPQLPPPLASSSVCWSTRTARPARGPSSTGHPSSAPPAAPAAASRSRWRTRTPSRSRRSRRCALVSAGIIIAARTPGQHDRQRHAYP